MTTCQPPTHFRFTQRSIEQLPAHRIDSPARFAEYSCSETTGLRLLVNRRGRRWLYMRTTFRGKKLVLKLGEVPALSLTDARKKVLAIRADIDRGVDPTQARKEQRNMPTFAEFAAWDYTPFIKANKRSANSDLSMLRIHLVPRWGSRLLDTITMREVQSYHAQIRQSHSAVSANKHLSVLSKLLGCAVMWNILPKNPCTGVSRFPQNPAQQRFLSPDEICRLYQAMEDAGPRSNMTVAALKLLLLTGTRKNEALRARWEDVDIEGSGIWRLPYTKNGKAHHVPLNDEAKALLRSLPRVPGCPWVFPGRNPAQPLVEVRHCLDRLRKIAGLAPLHVHTLRHSFASLCAQSGASLLQIKQLLNHSSVVTTQRYAHLTSNDLRAASQTAATAISEALKAK